jgi:hypothetical protein
MRIFTLMIAASLAMSAPVEAQRPQRQQQMQQELRQQITQRFLGMYAQTAGLNEAQQERFSEQVQASFEWGAEHSARQREAWQALEAQMRPGVGADIDSLNALVGALSQARVDEALHHQTEVAKLAEFLSPVQVAQFMIHMERFQRQVESVRGRRGAGRARGAPGGF